MASFEDLVALTQATSAGKQAGLSNNQAFAQAVQARNQGNLAQYTKNATGSVGITNTGIGTLYADRSEADQAAQHRQKIWGIINGTADRSEYDTIMAQAQGINNKLKKYDYQGDREEADAVSVAKQRNAEMAKRTQPSFSQYADRSEYDAMQSNKQALEKKLDEVNNSLAYAVTVDENDALQAQRKDILDRLNKIKETERANRLYDREAKGREYSSMRNNNDFALYSGIGMGMGYKDNGGYSVSGNKVNFANEYRDVIEKEYAAPHIVHRYSGTNNIWNLTPDEKQTYYYILAKEGEEKADEFLDWMQDTLNYRSAEKVANDIERDSGASRVAREIAAGLVSGNTSALSGIGQNLQSDARATSSDEFLQQMIQQNIAKRTGTENGGYSLEGIASSAANTIGNMIPSMAIGTLNPAAGAVTMGLSAKGNTYKQVLDEGYSKAQAEAVSIPTGIAEAALQYALGGISSLGGKVTNQAVEKATSKISNGLARSLVRLGISNLDEVTEELIQNKIGTVLRNGILGENESLSWNDDDWDTVLMTIVTTTLLNAPSAIGSSLSGVQNVQGLNQQSTEQTSLKNDAAPQNTQQSASDIPGNIQTPPAVQNAPVASPSLFNTQSNDNSYTGKKSSYYSGRYSLAYGAESAADIRRETSKFKNVVAGIDTSVKDFFHKWSNGRKSHLGDKLEKLYLGEITDEARAVLSNLLGYEVTSTDYILSNDGVKHILDEHGDPNKEIKNGNLPITDSVLESLPDVIANPDDISLGHKETRGDRIGIVFKKNLPDGTAVYVQFDNTGRGNIEGKTLYVKPATTPGVNADASANTFTSETAGPVAQTGANQTSHVVNDNTGAPSLNISIPNSGQNVNGNLLERGFSENIRTDAAMEEEVRAAFETDPSLYQQQSNSDTFAKAKEIYNKGTYEATRQLNDAISKAKAGSKLPVEMIPLSRLVANDLAKQGKVQEARDMLADIATELTYYGQASQAARILRDSDPMTQATAIERMVSRLNSELTKGQRRKNKALGRNAEGDIVVNQYLLQQYVKETDPAVKDQILSEMQQDIADQIPATFSEKFTAMRYLNMLGNLKTQGRNIIGNTAMLGVTKSKNLVKASIEGLASAVTGGKYERTTSFYVNSELRKEANADADLMMDVLSGQGKYSDANRVSNKDIQDIRKIFDSEFLEKYRKLTNWAMETGDRVFLKATYSDALGGWLQAHGINSISEATPEQLSKARAFAIKEAQEATFRDSNAISDWVSSIGRSKSSPAAVKFVSEGIAPFRKTPANVAVRAVEYSPLGLAETIVKLFQTKSGKANATDVINSLSKNIIGSALFRAGMLAASAGFARGTEDDEELDQFQKMHGAQDYSIKLRINGEDTYISLSQFAPAAVPFFIGVEFSNALQSEGNFVDKLPKIIGAVSGPMLEMSMLGGINDALSNLSTYGNTSSGLPMLFVNSAISYLTQGLTSTFLGQLEQANEEYRQTTYTDKNSIIPTWMQYPLGKAAAKTPGIDYNQQDYIDAWGRRQSNGNALQRFMNATVNPTYYSAERGTSVDDELERLYSENKNVEGFPNVLPDKASRSTEYTKGKTMTPEEYQQYSIDRGQMSLELIQDFMSGNDYQSLTDQQRAEVISNLYSLAADRAMKKVKTSNGVEYTGDLDDEASLSDIPAYYSYSTIMREAAFGKPTTDWQSVMKMMQNFTSLPDDVKTELKGKSDMHLKAVEYATNNGLSPEDWYSTYDVIKDAKVSTGSEAQLVSAIAINGTNKNLSDSDKLKMLQSQLPLAKDGKIPTIVRRYDVAMNSFGISFDDWTKFETELKDADSTSKWAIRSAAQSVGVNPDNAVEIYKTLYDDPKYTAQVNEEFLYLNPVDESGEVEPMSFTEYYNSFNEDQTPQETTTGFTPGMTPGMTENDYQKLMRMSRG